VAEPDASHDKATAAAVSAAQLVTHAATSQSYLCCSRSAARTASDANGINAEQTNRANMIGEWPMEMSFVS
jgi:hypothetical protein